MPRPATFGISKEMRLRQRIDYLSVQSGGRKLHGRHVLAIARRQAEADGAEAAGGAEPQAHAVGTELEAEAGHRGPDVGAPLARPGGHERLGRLGMTVTKKVGNAVVRNRIRRLMREWMRLNGWVPAGWDVVLVAKDSAARQLHPDDFASDLHRILRQLS